MPRDPKRAWEKDAGFKNKTTSAFIDTPGQDTNRNGTSIKKEAYYAVGIVCRSADGKRVSPLLSSFTYSINVSDDKTGDQEIGKSAFKVPDGEFPENWPKLLGVTVDPNLK